MQIRPCGNNQDMLVPICMLPVVWVFELPAPARPPPPSSPFLKVRCSHYMLLTPNGRNSSFFPFSGRVCLRKSEVMLTANSEHDAQTITYFWCVQDLQCLHLHDAGLYKPLRTGNV